MFCFCLGISRKFDMDFERTVNAVMKVPLTDIFL